MKKRRAVHNHIGTVHAIAACNLAEMCAGTMIEASLPITMRWLPKAMTVQYLKKCETDLVGEATTNDFSDGPARDVIVGVDIKDTHGKIVVRVDITMYVSPKKLLPSIYRRPFPISWIHELCPSLESNF